MKHWCVSIMLLCFCIICNFHTNGVNAFPIAGMMMNPVIYASGSKSQRPYQTEVNVQENEHVESVIKRFRKQVNASGHIQEARRRKHFENKQDILKRKQRTPKKRKGGKPRTMAEAIADKEAGIIPGLRGPRRPRKSIQ